MTLADMSVITAEVKVDETDIVNVQLGQSADVTVDALPGRIFKGYVTEVGDQALLRTTGVATSQSTTGTEEAKDFKVVVTLQVPSDDLRPGLSATAKITTAQKSNALTNPHPVPGLSRSRRREDLRRPRCKPGSSVVIPRRNTVPGAGRLHTARRRPHAAGLFCARHHRHHRNDRY